MLPFRVTHSSATCADLVLGVDAGLGELGRQVHDDVGVGLGLQGGVLEVRLEGGLDVLGLVDEVDDERLALLLPAGGAVGAVEPRQRLHRGHAGELLVDVHRREQRLVEPGLELVGDQHDLVRLALERRRQVRAGAGVHVGLGELVVLARRRAPVRSPDLVLGHRHRAGERHQGPVVVGGVLGGPLGDVGVDRLLVLHRGLAGVGHDHRLGLALEQVGDVGVEVLDDDLHLLADVGRVQLHPPHQALAWPQLSSTSPSPLLGVAGDLQRGLVGLVALEHVEDVALLDRLLHRVQVELARLRRRVPCGRTAPGSCSSGWR